MTELEALLNPEMEALLRELSARPRSLFLRADRRAAFRAVRSRTEEPISAMAVSDALERELVSVHRAELAEILRQACRTRLLEGEREKLFIMRYRSTNERVDPVPLADVRKRLGQASGAGMGEPWAGAIAAIQKALAPEDPEQVSVLDLAALGQRLVPGDAWRVCSAMASFANNDPGAAVELARAVLDGWPEKENARRACEILASVAARRGEYPCALKHQAAATSVGGRYTLGALNTIRFALQAGDSQAVVQASGELECLDAAALELVAESSAASLCARRCGEWTPSEQSKRLATAIGPELGQVARRVAHEYL